MKLKRTNWKKALCYYVDRLAALVSQMEESFTYRHVKHEKPDVFNVVQLGGDRFELKIKKGTSSMTLTGDFDYIFYGFVNMVPPMTNPKKDDKDGKEISH